jgi:hypothetical protein
MVNRLFFFLAALACVSSSAVRRIEPTQAPLCGGAVDCNRRGVDALAGGDTSTAIRLFKAQVGYAEDAQSKTQSLLAYNNLSVAYMRNQDYLRALSWAHLALRLDAQDKAGNHNLRMIEIHLAEHRWSTHLDGLYVQYAGKGQWNYVCVSEIEGHKIHFRFVGLRMGFAWREYGAGSYGDVEGDAVLGIDRAALYQSEKDFPSCRIRMRFEPGNITLDQAGECGFGYGVQAKGSFERVSDGTATPEHCGDRDLP